MIKQEELKFIIHKRKYISLINEKMDEPKAELKDAEVAVIKKLKKGEKVESGNIQVILNRTEKKYPPWKALLKELKGEAYLVKVAKETKSSVTETLIVDYMVKKEVKG